MDRVHVALRGLARRSLAARPGEQPARRAAVLVPLCNVGGEPCVLFTVRTRHVSSHKGQVAFPGGYQDPEGERARGRPHGPFLPARAATSA